MNDLLKSVKADLTDRRLVPLVAVVLVALVAAIAYAAFGGGSSSSPTASAGTGATASVPKGIAVSESQPAANEAIAETTDGTKSQRKGSVRNPFTELPGTAKAASSSSSSSAKSSPSTSSSGSSASAGSSTSAGSSSSSSSSKTSTGSSTPSKETKPSKSSTPAKKKTLYLVALQFGALPAGTSPEAAQLTPYAGVSKATPLPSEKERLLEFVGVTLTHEGQSASFAVDGEVILSGGATCLPSTAQCRVIDLKEGKTEQIQYMTPTGSLVTYELRVVSITKGSANAATVNSVRRTEGRIARSLFASDGALRLAGLRFSSHAGVLVFASRRAFGAHATSKHY